MALETIVFQQDPFSFGCLDFFNTWDIENYGLGGVGKGINLNQEEVENIIKLGSNGIWEGSSNSSPDINTGIDGFIGAGEEIPAESSIIMSGRRKRRRTKSDKNKEEMENQRMTHIAVERNRRRQMNDYLAVIRSLMPPSYSQRGDQASIVGGAINFVKKLEQLLQFLEAHRQLVKQQPISSIHSKFLTNFFNFPQYSTSPTRHNNIPMSDNEMAEKRSAIADIEVTMADNHANIKILARRRSKQLLTMVTGFYSLSLTILHLNITTVDLMVLYSFSVKVEDDCQLRSVNDVATAVHELVGMIQEEA